MIGIYRITGRKMSESPLGSHVVSNGLAAFWAFQGWGNAPETYADRFLSMMRTYFKKVLIGKMNTNREDWQTTLWNYDSWHFVVPTNPKAVFLDTRTQRDYDDEPRPVKFGQIIEETTWAPQLLSTKWLGKCFEYSF